MKTDSVVPTCTKEAMVSSEKPQPMARRFAVTAAVLVSTLCLGGAALKRDVFARSNLLAFCIIPFDSSHRTPVERAAMLKKLGIERMAIDWRKSDIPNFDAEIAAMRANKIAIQGFWVRGNMYPERDSPTSEDGSLAIVLDTLERNHLQTEIWDPFDADDAFMALPEDQRLARATEAVRYVAQKAERIHCKVAIYSHGGWMGEPENELKVLKAVGMKNVGIVYDYEHGKPQMDRFPEFFPKLVPHLYAVLLLGMKEGGPMVMDIGDGDRDLGMLKVIRNSGYQGPIGVMNHVTTRDAEVGLRKNMDGLKNLLREMDDLEALKTY